MLAYMSWASEHATNFYEDSQGCIALDKNLVFHSRSEHIDIKFQILREKVILVVIELEYRPTDEIVAYGLAMALGQVKHVRFTLQ